MRGTATGTIFCAGSSQSRVIGRSKGKRMKVDVYVAAENKQPRKGERWTGFLIRAEVNGQAAERVGVKNSDSTLYKAMIMTIVEALDRFTRPAEITIHLDSDWILGKLIVIDDGKRTLDVWQENGWKTSRGTEIKNRDEWQRLYNKLRVFENSGARFHFEKLPEDDRNREKIIFTIEQRRIEP